MASPAALMLFGGHLEVQHEEGLVSPSLMIEKGMN